MHTISSFSDVNKRLERGGANGVREGESPPNPARRTSPDRYRHRYCADAAIFELISSRGMRVSLLLVHAVRVWPS